MGASIAAAANCERVVWAGDGRSNSSHQRATQAGLENCGSLTNLVESSDIILSVCPPHDALAVAKQMSALKFDSIYVDCNAIAPSKSRQLVPLFNNFVDGGIIGGPAWKKEYGTTLYLSGEDCAQIAELFDDSPLIAKIISNQIGDASALKMAFAAYTKGSTALLAAILCLAEQEGIRKPLEEQWGETFTQQTHSRLLTNSSKAWRFSGEMREIASTFQEVSLPGGFHDAAADIFDRLAEFKNDPAKDIEQLLNAPTQEPD